MPTNDFLPYAVGGSANVETQAAYAAETALLANGLTSGIVPSNKLNKTLRQSSIISAMVAQFIADNSGANSVDDGTIATLEANLAVAIKAVMAGSISSKIQPITAAVASNALTLTLNPTSIDFRSSSLSSGAVNTRTIGAAISVVVPSGATLGTVNATAARLAILAMDNAGTVELAVVNLAGGTNLDETTLISTTAISAAATADNVIYSTTARTNLPFRVVGFVDATETTAGTWSTAPSTIQGAGGIAISGFDAIGSGIGLSIDGTQSLPNNVETDVNWQIEDFKDADFIHAANGSTVTINKSGRYLVAMTIAFNTSLAGNYGAYIFQNAVRRSANYGGYPSSGGGQSGVGSAYLNCKAGDVIKVTAIQASGGSVSLFTNSHVGITRVR